MNPRQALTLVLALVLVTAPLIAFNPIGHSVAPITCDVTWSGYPGVNLNTTDPYHILYLANSTTVGNTFTLECHLLGATVANVPAGVKGAEVHMDFSQILPWATLTGVDDEVSNNATGLLGSSALMGIPFGIYESDSATLVHSPYVGGMQVIFAGASSSGVTNGADFVLFKLTFTISTMPDTMSNPVADPVNEVFLNVTSFSDPTPADIGAVPMDGFLQLQRATFIFPPVPVVSIAPPAVTGPLTVGNPLTWTIGISTAPFWDIAGFDVNVTWNPALLAYSTYTDGNYLTRNSDPDFLFNFTTPSSVEVIGTQLSDAVYSNSKVPASYTLFTVTLTNTNVSTVYPPPTCHVAIQTDLVSWAHPEYPVAPWYGSITAVDVPYSPTNNPGTHNIASPGYSIYTEGYLPQGAAIDLFTTGFAEVGNQLISQPLGSPLAWQSPYNGQGTNMESDSFAPQQLVYLYANVTYAQDRVSNKLVTFQVNNALGQKVTILQNYTDANGIASVQYRIPMSDYLIGGNGTGTWDPAIFGDWNVVATVEVDQVTVNDTMSIPVGWLMQVYTVTSNQPKYLKYAGIPMNFTAVVLSFHEQPLTALISVDSYDAQSYPIGETSWWVTLHCDRNATAPGMIIPTFFTYGAISGIYYGWGNIPYGPYQHVSVSGNSIYQGIPTWTRIGVESVVGYCTTDYPFNGGTPLGPQSNADGTTTTFQIALS
jgi:hypothetical protein